jgi:hypothetical protein
MKRIYQTRLFRRFAEGFANTVVSTARHTGFDKLKELKVERSARTNGVLSVLAGLGLAILFGSISKFVFWICLVLILIYWLLGGILIFFVVSTKFPRPFMALLIILLLLGGGILVLIQRYENPASLLCVYGGVFSFFCYIFLRIANRVIISRLNTVAD